MIKVCFFDTVRSLKVTITPRLVSYGAVTISKFDKDLKLSVPDVTFSCAVSWNGWQVVNVDTKKKRIFFFKYVALKVSFSDVSRLLLLGVTSSKVSIICKEA